MSDHSLTKPPRVTSQKRQTLRNLPPKRFLTLLFSVGFVTDFTLTAHPGPMLGEGVNRKTPLHFHVLVCSYFLGQVLFFPQHVKTSFG